MTLPRYVDYTTEFRGYLLKKCPVAREITSTAPVALQALDRGVCFPMIWFERSAVRGGGSEPLCPASCGGEPDEVQFNVDIIVQHCDSELAHQIASHLWKCADDFAFGEILTEVPGMCMEPNSVADDYVKRTELYLGEGSLNFYVTSLTITLTTIGPITIQ